MPTTEAKASGQDPLARFVAQARDTSTQYARERFTRAKKRSGMALCLSGGGYRAALFHLGAMRRLNELGVLSVADTISGAVENQFYGDRSS
jgi:predicted acylesterase/phospholipase RssA